MSEVIPAGTALQVPVHGLSFHCRIDGAPSAPWLVFSNSLGTDLSLWDDQVEAFGAAFRILRYDQRGHGGTDVPAGPCDFGQLTDDLAALFDHFAIDQAVLAGVSMGGVTALSMAARHPGRVAAVVASDCPWASSAEGAALWEERIGVVSAGGMAALVEPTLARWFTPASLRQEAAAVGRVRAMLAGTPAAGFIACARALQGFDIRAGVESLRMPALLVAGEADGALPAMMRAMAEAVPGASFRAIDGAGHLPNIERPAAFDGCLTEFFRRHGLHPAEHIE